MRTSPHDYNRFTPRRADRPKRPPLRTVAELAAEFGVSAISLGTQMAADAQGPRPVTKHGTGTYYDPGMVRAWWNLKQRTAL